jgi:hypothetical protein
MKRENQREHKEKVNGVEPVGDALSIQRKIALRAYDLYLQRGGADGHAEDDWLQAELEVLKKEGH